MPRDTEIMAGAEALWKFDRGYTFWEQARAVIVAAERVRIAENVSARVIEECGREYHGS